MIDNVTRVVVPVANDGNAWAVRLTADGDDLSTFHRKEDAVAHAKKELEDSATGGVLEILRRDRGQESRRTVQPSGVAGLHPPTETFGGALAGVRQSKKHADQTIDVLLGNLWPWLTLFAGPAMTGLIAPQVEDERTVAGVFLATLAWSTGCLLAYLLIQVKPFGDLQGWPLVGGVAVCLIAGALLAAGVGRGAYSVVVVPQGGGPFGVIFGFIGAAVATFGALGALLGAGSGVWAGYQVARLVKATA